MRTIVVERLAQKNRHTLSFAYHKVLLFFRRAVKNWFSEAKREENEKILAAQQFYKDKVLKKCFEHWKQVF